MSLLLYTVKEAAEATGISEIALKAAIKQDYTNARAKDLKRLPRLPAKAPNRAGHYYIRARDLEDWIDQLPDA